MKKTIDITDPDELREGDIVTLRCLDTTVIGPLYRDPPTGVLMVQSTGWRAALPNEFVSATREVEVPDLPTELGSLIWTKHHDLDAHRRMLVYHPGLGALWSRGHWDLMPGDVKLWQPVTAETFDAPDDDAWIEVPR